MSLVFDVPEWDELIGGSTELEWLADRQRKFDLAALLAERILHTVEQLRARDELFHCTPEALATIPLAADWYVSLAGYALNTLGNISESPAQFGLTVLCGLRMGGRKRAGKRSSAWHLAQVRTASCPDSRPSVLAIVPKSTNYR